MMRPFEPRNEDTHIVVNCTFGSMDVKHGNALSPSQFPTEHLSMLRIERDADTHMPTLRIGTELFDLAEGLDFCEAKGINPLLLLNHTFLKQAGSVANEDDFVRFITNITSIVDRRSGEALPVATNYLEGYQHLKGMWSGDIWCTYDVQSVRRGGEALAAYVRESQPNPLLNVERILIRAPFKPTLEKHEQASLYHGTRQAIDRAQTVFGIPCRGVIVHPRQMPRTENFD